MATNNAFLNTSANQQIANHYAAISALTPKDRTEQVPKIISDNPAYSFLFSPLLGYGVIILFFGLFLGAIAIQLFYRILDFKKGITTLVVALMLATLPLGVRFALEQTNLPTHASPDEIPRVIQLTQLSANSLSVSWQTQVEKSGTVRFSKAPLDETLAQVAIADGGQKTTTHLAKLENLEKGVTYELEILSGGKWYNQNGVPIRFSLQ